LCLVFLTHHIIALKLVSMGQEKLHGHFHAVSLVLKVLEQDNSLTCPIKLEQETSVGEHGVLVFDLKAQTVTHVLFGLLEVTLTKVELGKWLHQLRVTFLVLLELQQVLFGVGWPLSQEFFLLRHALQSLFGWLASLLLDQVLTLTVSLLGGDGDHEMELISLCLDHLLHGLAHLVNQVHIQF